MWRAAKTIFIPKPGKTPSIENLCPISLTSCVGKALQHVLMNRWQKYLEDDLFPESMIGFRSKLSTQDAMRQLKAEIIDDKIKAHDKKAILGLYLLSTFDKIKHAVVLAQICGLNMGVQTHNYVREFLSERTPEIHVGDIMLEEKKLGSIGPPQGSAISPLLFNLVVIGVGRRVKPLADVRNSIYADDITLWLPGGSNGNIDSTLQHAVEAIESQLDGSGLVCSPSKSELFVLPPKGGRRKTAEEEAAAQDKIVIRTSNGQLIPEVGKIRVVGTLFEKRRMNGKTIKLFG